MYDLFSDFFDNFDGFDIFPKAFTSYTGAEEKRCPVCGHTFSDFSKTGKFGCGECYNTFRTPVTETLRRIHSNPVHTGKVPSRCAGSLKRERLYADLKKQLAEAVQSEDYEKAAKLHKQIKEMESDM